VVVVSNRVPATEEAQRQAGGLVTGVMAALATRGGIWFGWSGRVHESPPATVRTSRRGPIEFATVDLSPREHRSFYLGYANGTLWPLLHFRTGFLEYDRDEWRSYLEVNARFARRLRPLLRDDDLVWVHDYQLMPLGRCLRELGVRNAIGFFLHVPMPPVRMLVTLPHHAELFAALGDYDLVGFQTPDDADSFRRYCLRELHWSVDGDGAVLAPQRRTRIGAFPIGIDPEQQARNARDAVRRPAARRLIDSLVGRRLILGVDRLDYSKGLIYRYNAFDRLLEEHPEWRARVTYLQIAAPSREDLSRYRETRRELEQCAGHINAQHAEFDWVPLRFVNRMIGPGVIAGFYRVAGVAVVTPLRDGMNLVAKEFVASQDEADPGVLLLSPFAGAVHELKGALLVNPYDQEGFADALHQALQMPREERQQRWRSMISAVRANTAADWQSRFLTSLAEGSRVPNRTPRKRASAAPENGASATTKNS
jgi:trehalose 6-phosphate synthase